MSNFKKEVYIAYGLDNEVLYVGQGNIGRSSHCYSGASHNKHLNRYYFLNGEDGSIRTEIFAYTNCEKDAVKIEIDLIKELSPTCNSIHQIKPDIIRPNFTRDSKEYYNSYLELLSCTDSNRATELKLQMQGILDFNKNLDKMLEHITIEEIKSTYYNSTKSRRKYNNTVGVCQSSQGKTSAIKELNISKGSFKSYSELKEIIQVLYDSKNLDLRAKATDIKEVYNVKRTKRQGVEGFLIGSKL